MAKVTALKFSRRLGEMQDTAQREPVEIIKHGRKHAVLLGAAMFDALVARARQRYAAADLPDDILAAVKAAQMDPRHAALDKLLKK
jgi:prevent-host-death family protein